MREKHRSHLARKVPLTPILCSKGERGLLLKSEALWHGSLTTTRSSCCWLRSL